jgi:hypothetical protein
MLAVNDVNVKSKMLCLTWKNVDLGPLIDRVAVIISSPSRLLLPLSLAPNLIFATTGVLKGPNNKPHHLDSAIATSERTEINDPLHATGLPSLLPIVSQGLVLLDDNWHCFFAWRKA